MCSVSFVISLYLFVLQLQFCLFGWCEEDTMSGTEDVKDQEMVDGNVSKESQKMMPSSQQEVEFVF